LCRLGSSYRSGPATPVFNASLPDRYTSIAAHKGHASAAATKAVEKVNQDIKPAGVSAAKTGMP
jgi:hypothetical protein